MSVKALYVNRLCSQSLAKLCMLLQEEIRFIQAITHTFSTSKNRRVCTDPAVGLVGLTVELT